MKIAIDLQSCQTDSRDRGIGRYSMSLVSAMSDCLSGADEIVIGVDAADVERLRDVRGLLRGRAVHANVAATSYPNTNMSDLSPAVSAVAGMMRANFYASLGADVLLVTSFFEVGSCYSTSLQHAALEGMPTAVIAYDIIPLLFPERYLPSDNFIDRWYRGKVEEFKKFDLFLAISEATRRDLIEHLGIEPERIRMVGAGLDDAFAASPRQDGEDRLSALGINDPFVLMVGNADWRKNSIGALEAFAALPAGLRKRYQLVFTQVGDDVRAALKGKYSHLRDRVVIAGKVCESTLAQLYAHCHVFFFPSFYEGFGLPVLEAMAQGALVLSSDQGALAEVVHDKRTLFDPRDPKSSASVLQRVLEDDAFRDSLLVGARDHALTFTWERCAREVLKSLSEWVAEHPAAPASDWRPSMREIAVMAEASVETGPAAEHFLRNGLQAIASGGERRILVDITEVVRLDARSGIQRVVRNYAVGLMAEARTHGQIVEPICWTERGIHYARAYAREKLDVACEGDDDIVDVQANDLLFMLDSSWWTPERFDALSGQIWQAGGEVVWMVYDLVPIDSPEYCDPTMPPAFRYWLEHVVPSSDGFVCISESTRQDLERFIGDLVQAGHRRPWTRSLHLGSDLESGRLTALASDSIVSVCEGFAGRPWLVALGTVEPRKDYATVLAAYEQLWADHVDVGLVIIGKQGWNVDSLAQRLRSHAENGKRLFWLEGLSDGDVQYLLTHSSALVQASIAEGFGLPVVEAGSLGVPLLLSDIPVFHEIAGDEATYFPVSDPVALAGLIAARVTKMDWKKPEKIRTMTWGESSAKLAKLLRCNTVQ